MTLDSQIGIDGRAAGDWDANNDYFDFYSSELNDDFDGNEGSAIIWVKPTDASVWTDTSRYIFYLKRNSSNFIEFKLTSVDNRVDGKRNGGGAGSETSSITGVTSTDWELFGMVWSQANNETKAYYQGSFHDVEPGGGVFTGNLNSGGVLLGALTKSAQSVWDGFLAHFALWTTPLTLADFDHLRKV